MRTLALDPGERRIGVAISDPTGSFAQPLETIETRGSASRAALARIGALVDEYEVERVVIGLPLHMDGREGTAAESARRLGALVAEERPVVVEFLDERWTSLEAERHLRALGGKLRSRRDKGRVDRVAATLLLQTWLDRAGSGPEGARS